MFGKAKYGPKRRMGRMRSKGVVIEEDSHTTCSAPRTVYMGHYTHPQDAVINTIFYALAKFIFLRVNHCVPQTLDDIFQAHGGGQSDSIFTMRYRLKPNNNDDIKHVDVTVPGSQTVKVIGELIRDAVRAQYIAHPDTELYWEQCTIRPDSAGSLTLQITNATAFSLRDVKVGVTGASYMKLQNVTLADNLGSTDRHDIHANPVEGRCYYGEGSLFEVKYAGQNGTSATAGEGKFAVDSQYGTGVFGSTDFTDAQLDRILEHPPQGRVINGVKHDRYVRIQPGTMIKSTLSKTHILPFNRWMAIYRTELVLANPSGISKKTSIGRSRWYGVDKMIHDSTDDNTILNREVHIRMTGCVYHKKRYQVTAPYPEIQVLPTIV